MASGKPNHKACSRSGFDPHISTMVKDSLTRNSETESRAVLRIRRDEALEQTLTDLTRYPGSCIFYFDSNPRAGILVEIRIAPPSGMASIEFAIRLKKRRSMRERINIISKGAGTSSRICTV